MIRGLLSRILGNLIVSAILVIIIILLALLAICWMIPGSSPCTILEIFGLGAWIPS